MKAAEAAQDLSPDEADILKLAEKAFNELKSEKDESCKHTDETKAAEKVLDQPNDELCPDKEYAQQLKEKYVTYFFQSDYGEWDIEDTLSELISNDVATLESRIRMTPLGADHLCSVKVKSPSFSWPEMKGENAEIIREIKRIQM